MIAMRSLGAAAAVMALVGCGAVNKAALVTSTASLVCDWAQTRSAARTGWATTMEGNPIMGPTPTTRTVDLYFAGTIAINTALWIAMPRRAKSIVPIAVTAAQVPTIAGNASTTRTICGFR